MDLFAGLSPEQSDAVSTLDEDLEIIACAGAGKTGVVTRRIINIIKTKGVAPENIVAFTFTEKAGEELKARIYKYAELVLGNTNGFANMYVGTIHGFCLKMLQEYITEFQKFTVLDTIKTKLFIKKNFTVCGMSDFGLSPYTKYDTGLFLSTISLLNENWFDSDKWDANTQAAVEKYRKCLYEKKYFDYSLIMREMVSQLESNKEFASQVLDKVKYLTVDEYQDINPIQERLIKLIKSSGCNLCIVGDDDQTIYEFRGSDPSNILTFKERYNIQKYIILGVDYRSSEAIVDIASRVIKNNYNRLPKTIKTGNLVKYDEGDSVYREFETTEEECAFIAERIVELHKIGIPYSEMAVLLRIRKFGGYMSSALDRLGVPYIVEGVNALFETPECIAAQNIFKFLHNDIDQDELLDSWKNIGFELDNDELQAAIDELLSINVDELMFYGEFILQQIFHDFLRKLSIVENEDNSRAEIILYNLGKFSQVINDFETIYFATIPKNKLRDFCNFLQYEAAELYPEGHLTNAYIRPDAVSIMTVHQAKGLEYTAVFIPHLTQNVFPARKQGGKSEWHIIDKSYISNSSRIAGDDDIERLEGERKLFYVAITRAKKYLFITRSPSPFAKTYKKVSCFFAEVKESPYMIAYDSKMSYEDDTLPKIEKEKAPLNLNFSILSDYFDCAYRFKLSMFYGFVQPIVPAMGYGKAMHEIVQNIHRKYIAGEVLKPEDVNKIVEESFYLPYANTKLEENMRNSARKSSLNYFEKNKDDFKDITMAEADIELDLGDGIKINGRIDLVKKREISGEEKTYIVDFKTANRDVTECINAEQLKIYALGYQVLTGEKADYLEIYNLDNSEQQRERVTDELLTNVKKDIRNAANKIRTNDLPRECSSEKCSKCYLNYLCLTRKEKRDFGL